MKLIKQSLILFFGLVLSMVAFASSYDHGKDTSNQTITAIAVANPNFSTLVKALKVAGLADVLNKPGEYTVFAPTNAAFAALPKGTLTALLQDPTKLKAILLYHVVEGKVMSSDIKPGLVKTLEGSDIDISVKHDKVYVNNALVTTADIKAANGVIHVINAVLLPTKK